MKHAFSEWLRWIFRKDWRMLIQIGQHYSTFGDTWIDTRTGEIRRRRRQSSTR